MTILLYKNGQWLIDGEQPLEGVSLDNLAAILSNPSDGDVIKYDEASGMWIAGKAIPAVSAVDNGKVLTVSDGAWTPASPANPLPSVSSSDNGKVLGVVDGAWAAQQKKFIVTLTPTSPDYSGTMDHTVAEINAAYEAGQEIVFNVLTSATSHMMIPVANVGYSDAFDYPSFNAYLFDNNTNVMVLAFTATTNDGTKQTYGTFVYSLTPAS